MAPNIVLILADDLGYGDLSCQNPASRIQTPRLDRLASEGVRFTDAHAPSALCTPSRYSILTGQDCWRTRLKSGVLNMWDEPLIAPEQLTMAGLLRNNGYRTACFGKWHLGLSWPFVGPVPQGFNTQVKPSDIDWTRRIGGGPVDCGFDYYFGVNIANEPPYAFLENDHVVGVPTVAYPTVAGQQSHWAGPGVAGWDWAQSLPEITARTVRWLQAVQAGPAHPFFLYAPLVGPHQPVMPTTPFQGSSRAGAYGDYVQELDWAVGELLDALEATGVATNTLVLFTSDNGPDEYAYDRLKQSGHASMGALRGIKMDIWEGGHRVPFLARWPGNIRGGTTNDQTICLVDLMRTMADIVGTEVPADAAQDSVSFLPALLGTPTSTTNRLLVLESGQGQFGIRSNNWMYIASSTGDGHDPELEPLWFEQSRQYPTNNQSPALLYELGGDLGERTNLLGQKPQIANQLQSQLRYLRSSAAWRGAVSGDWGTAKNWMPAEVPFGGDVVYSNLVGLTNFTQVLSGTFAVNSIFLDRSVRTKVRIQGNSGAQLSVANGIDMGAATTNLSIEAGLALSQSQLWNIGAGHALQIGGPLALQGHVLTLCGRGDIFLSNTVSGAGSLVIRSSGTTFLEGQNDFSGGIELSGGGVLVAGTSRALGSGELLIPNNSTLAIAPGVTVTNAATLQGSGAESGGRPGAVSVEQQGSGVYAGPMRLSGDVGLGAIAAGSCLIVSGPISGPDNVTILPGAGRVIFQTNQTYTGSTRIEGRLSLSGGPDQLPTSGEVWFTNDSSAELDLNGADQSLATISGGGPQGGNIILGAGTLTVAPPGVSTYSGTISGPGNLHVLGSGTLNLGGTNVYTGTTTVSAGTLAINGSLANSEVVVDGGTLTGSGTIAGPVRILNQGVLSLAIRPVALALQDQLVLSPAATTRVELDAAQGQPGAAQGLTSVVYAGTLWVSNVSPASVFTNGETFHLFSSTISSGTFSRICPAPGPGLAWQFDAAKGLLRVRSVPQLRLSATGANAMAISWADQGFHLQVMTNSMGINPGSRWFDYPGGATSPVVLPGEAMPRNVFFRLVSP